MGEGMGEGWSRVDADGQEGTGSLGWAGWSAGWGPKRGVGDWCGGESGDLGEKGHVE